MHENAQKRNETHDGTHISTALVKIILLYLLETLVLKWGRIIRFQSPGQWTDEKR